MRNSSTIRLTDDEWRDVLVRATEMEQTSRHGEAFHAELEAVIDAAEQVGPFHARPSSGTARTLEAPNRATEAERAGVGQVG